jgi:hypothetical protein
MSTVMEILTVDSFSYVYNFFQRYPEAVLVVGFLLFLLVRGKFHAALMLLLGITLCCANYYLFFQFSIYAISLPYAIVCAGVSIFLLILILYQLLQTA